MHRVAAVLLLVVSLAAQCEEPNELTFNDLFRPPAIHNYALSPNGEFVTFFRDNTLVVGNSASGFSDVRNFNDTLSIHSVEWSGPETVWVESFNPHNNRQLFTAVRLVEAEDGSFAVEKVKDHYLFGYINDLLPEDGNHVIFARLRIEDDTIVTNLFRINVFDPVQKQQTRRNRIDTGSEEFFYYEQNAAGEYTLGIRIAESRPEIWLKNPEDGMWQGIWAADAESEFIPWQISEDNQTLWVLTDALSDKMAAVEFDLENLEFGEILYEHDRVDIDAIIMSNDDRSPTGVIYSEAGLVRYHFFSEDKNAEFARLQSHFPGQGIILVGYSENSSVRLVFASSSTERGSIHVCDIARDQCNLVESIAPWMEGKLLNETLALEIPSTDNIVVEAYLTLPHSKSEDVPLIALPHGGPIGISDDRYFSSEVQWLALNGYAVLQVNYRGSGGYGQEFEAAGLRQWGRGIEEDIENAVRKVLEDYPQLDGEKVGIFGGSYGGYSAIMSVIRNPDLFRCAASWAGVMDLTLLFTQSSMSRSEYLRNTLTSYVGDPDVDFDEQREHSPVYRYKEIKRPILLGHGMEDTIVDVEHSWRLRKLMVLTGADPEFILLEDVGHGFEYISEAKQFYGPLLAFLDEQLKPD